MSQYRGEIERFAADRNLDPDLVEAIVLKESDDNAFAWRYEPGYRYLWDVKRNRPFRELTADERRSEVAPSDFPYLGVSRNQEFIAQQASWGLMQIMGGVARELGYAKPYLTELTDVRQNIALGTRLLKRLLTRLSGSVEMSLQAYNGGLGSIGQSRVKAYSADVLRRYDAIKKANANAAQ